eukprot:m.39696 g.39696  ORF g.39696 m.39696 type:complete len:70 (-) comp11300_c0_seq2:213-422(-)
MGDGGVTEEEISKFREAFFGKNGPGHVTLAQLRELATAIGEPDIPDTTLQVAKGQHVGVLWISPMLFCV